MSIPAGDDTKETDVTGARPGGDTEYEWHVKRPQDGVSRWSADLTEEYQDPLLGWEYKSVDPYRGRYWAYSQSNLIKFWCEGRLIHRKTGMPRMMQFADEMPGISLQDLWDDIPPVLGDERCGYPTQKPLRLLERILAVSSNPGDVVLDPFCGCATACIAAERLNRQWIGVDISAKAAELVNLRMHQDLGLLTWRAIHRTDIPQRTDLGALPAPNCRANREYLYGRQSGECAGCRTLFAAPTPRSRPHHRTRQRRHRPLGQPPTPLRPLQPRQGRPRHGVPAYETPASRLSG